MRRFFFTIIAIIALVVLYQNCGNDGFKASYQIDMQTMSEKIQSSMSLACTRDEECTQMAMGSRACGGPSSYLVYSKTNTNEDLLIELVTAYTNAEAKFNMENELIGTCDMRMPYQFLSCSNSICVGKN